MKNSIKTGFRFVLALISVPCLFLAAIAAGTADIRAVELVPGGSTWKYLDDGSDQGSSWTGPGFDDTLWAAGPAHRPPARDRYYYSVGTTG